MASILSLKHSLVRCGKELYAARLVIGAGGNISARHGRTIYIKRSGVSLAQARAGDYLGVPFAGRITTALTRASSTELPMHRACYAARPDIGAVVHTHPVYATAAGRAYRKIDDVSYEFTTTFGSPVTIVPFIEPGSHALAQAIERSMRTANGIILRGHGAVTVGRDIDEACLRMHALERACAVLFIASCRGK